MALYRADAQRTWKVVAFAVISLGALRPTVIAEEEKNAQCRVEYRPRRVSGELLCLSWSGCLRKGELANKLVKPPSMAMIAENNGGTFPFWRVFDIIAGDTKVEDHDTSQVASLFRAYARSGSLWSVSASAPPHARAHALS